MNNVDVVCVGQALIDCITRGKEPYKKNVYRAHSISLSVGGDAINEASILRRLGKKVKLVCGLGNDMAGNLVLDAARERGLDVSLVTRREDIVTPIANLMVDDQAGRVSYNSPATMLPDYIPDPSVVKGAKVLSLASVFRAPLDTKEAIIALVKAAKAEGALVCMDTKIPTYREISIEDIAEILPFVDYMFPNENEAAYMTGKTDFMEMATYLHEMGVKNVIVKTGKEGCTVCGEKEAFHMPALDVEAIDSTGAGDNFVAGFIAALLDGEDLKNCCKKGTACAAECVQHAGAY
ncbi:MAG: sugar kinase [Eubacteriales bacterium]|nr:sugar kinase [Eubacteriales bacterium]